MQREPFGEILTETLEPFWSRQHNESFNVQWYWNSNPPTPERSMDFLCNIYLNAIFPVGMRNGALEPIRREFSRSVVPWRTPLQFAYCKLALSPRSARWFKQATLRVTPAHDSLAKLVIIPGNNKLRILDRQKNVVHGVLKHGFPTSRFQNEIAARQQAQQLGIPTPELIDCDTDTGWFTERYVLGTPLNRVSNNSRAAEITRRSFDKLNRLVESTTRETTVSDYVNEIANRTLDLCERNQRLDDDQKTVLLESAAQLADQLLDSNDACLTTAQTHGDFQPANVLVNDDQFWIIDWEYFDRRQQAYDLLVFDCQARSGRGLTDRLRRFVEHGFANDAIRSPEYLSSRATRQWSAALLLLEELNLRLDENTNPRFTKLDDGLSVLTDEIHLWTKST